MASTVQWSRTPYALDRDKLQASMLGNCVATIQPLFGGFVDFAFLARWPRRLMTLRIGATRSYKVPMTSPRRLVTFGLLSALHIADVAGR
jgi:hypothetical protein